jgi:hypothetical protein
LIAACGPSHIPPCRLSVIALAAVAARWAIGRGFLSSEGQIFVFRFGCNLLSFHCESAFGRDPRQRYAAFLSFRSRLIISPERVRLLMASSSAISSGKKRLASFVVEGRPRFLTGFWMHNSPTIRALLGVLAAVAIRINLAEMEGGR